MIKHRRRMQQVINFSGLRYGNIYPTDIDAFLDFSGQLFVFIELKVEGGEVPFGQRLALERLCRLCKTRAIAVVAKHTVFDKHKDIKLINCVVKEYYFNEEWIPASVHCTIGEFVEIVKAKYTQGVK